jgi:hypothetical protein
MNLKEFIDHRQYCPICETQLVTTFHSARKQTIKIEEHRFQVFFALDGRKSKQKQYAMAYSFDLETLQFQVEFYTKDKATRYETAHDFLRDRFTELHKNLKQFRFIRECTFCEQYSYNTQFFTLELKTANYEPLTVSREEFGLVHQLKDGHRLYKLSNHYIEGRSQLTFWKGDPCEVKVKDAAPGVWQNPTTLNLPIIPFVSKEATTQRLNSLLIFT